MWLGQIVHGVRNRVVCVAQMASAWRFGRASTIHDEEPMTAPKIAVQYDYLTPSGAVGSEHASKDSDALFKLTAAKQTHAIANPSQRFAERRVGVAMWSTHMRRDRALRDQ
jgi:hypothetical protein